MLTRLSLSHGGSGSWTFDMPSAGRAFDWRRFPALVSTISAASRTVQHGLNGVVRRIIRTSRPFARFGAWSRFLTRNWLSTVQTLANGTAYLSNPTPSGVEPIPPSAINGTVGTGAPNTHPSNSLEDRRISRRWEVWKPLVSLHVRREFQGGRVSRGLGSVTHHRLNSSRCMRLGAGSSGKNDGLTNWNEYLSTRMSYYERLHREIYLCLSRNGVSERRIARMRMDDPLRDRAEREELMREWIGRSEVGR